MLINYVASNTFPNLFVPWVAFLQNEGIILAWFSIFRGYWQRKWVHVQCMRCSKGRCQLNIKFSVAILYLMTRMASSSSSQSKEGKGLFGFWWRLLAAMFFTSFCWLLSCTCPVESAFCSIVGHLGESNSEKAVSLHLYIFGVEGRYLWWGYE